MMKYSNVVNSVLSTAALGFLALGLASTSAFANNANTTFAVNATVVNACTVSATAMAFGTVVPSASAATYTSTQSAITVNCSTGDVYSVALTAGISGVEGTRYMQGTPTTNHLLYALFNDSARSTNWGTTAGFVGGTGSGVAQVLPVYGQISTQTAPPNGAYSDTITVNVTY